MDPAGDRSDEGEAGSAADLEQRSTNGEQHEQKARDPQISASRLRPHPLPCRCKKEGDYTIYELSEETRFATKPIGPCEGV
jgi:hypothetical protein